jgi:hypothetical protein
VAQGLCLRCLGGSLGESLNCHFRGGAGVSAVWVCVCVCVCVYVCVCVCETLQNQISNFKGGSLSGFSFWRYLGLGPRIGVV